MSETKSINKVDLFGNEVNVAFNLIWPVGVTYPQYPGQKSPMDLWGEFSTWEKINYEGAFFRAAGGNANPWIEVTTTDGQNFTVTSSDVSSTVLKQNAKVKFNGETRTVSSTGSGSSVPSFTVSSAFTEPDGGYQNITNVYILQAESFKSHKHDVIEPNNGQGHSHGITQTKHSHGILDTEFTVLYGNSGSWTYASYSGMNISSGLKNTKGADANITINTTKSGVSIDYSGGDETRPANYAMQIWKRTA